ncbi:MAG TPA: hypothetical protein VF503_20760 [Sphingobium sp.]|uniref:hypothetical protein n=1 Tax=Sphingobium sp. TaxID=1912891 RepID=UPI002ED69530
MTTEQVTLQACPPGLFLFNGYLGFKTEYPATVGKDNGNGEVTWTVSCWPEAYVVESGEFFWGGAKTHADRATLLVSPVNMCSINPTPATGAECAGWRTMESAPIDGERLNLCWQADGGLPAHVELGKWSASQGGWCNTYGKPFGPGDPDFWQRLPTPPNDVPATPTPEQRTGQEGDAEEVSDDAQWTVARASAAWRACAGSQEDADTAAARIIEQYGDRRAAAAIAARKGREE